MSEGFLNPGSDRARAAGCICPVMDNNHGMFPPYGYPEGNPDGAWWVRAGCPLHARIKAEGDE